MGLANYLFVYTTQQDISFLLNSRTLWIHTNFVICYNSKLLFYKAVVENTGFLTLLLPNHLLSTEVVGEKKSQKTFVLV